MPIPEPKEGESEQEFISRCVSQLKKEDPDRDQDQILAICFKKWEQTNK